MKYIAYGSNTHVENMKKRCPNSSFLETSYLDGYTLVYRGRDIGYLTIEKEAGKKVPILLWDIADQDKKHLMNMKAIQTYIK